MFLIVAGALFISAALVAVSVPLERVRVLSGLLTTAGTFALLGDAVSRLVTPGPWGTVRVAVAVACAASSALSALHGLSYSAAWDGTRRSRALAAGFAIFVGGLYGVVVAEDYWALIVAWEIMTLASAVLVGVDYERPDTRVALAWYLGIGQISPLAFTLAVAVAAPPSWSIESIARSLAAASGPAQNLAFVALLLGAAAKAGLVPLHSWLPRAHPAAPSHVSAVMSGAMVTLGLLVFSRLAPLGAATAHPWWGWLLVTLGVVSVFLGVLNALVDGDLKRVLAYSTIENMGLLAVELALGLGFFDISVPVQRLALAAAGLHVVVHALAKTGLFLSAGTLIHLSGTRLLDRMGGLLRSAPVPATAFILCAMSAAAIPPLAGFAGELMLLRALVGAAHEVSQVPATALAAATAVIALGGAIAAGAYARAIGIALLGSSRSAQESHLSVVGLPEKVAVAVPAAVLLAAPLIVAALGLFGAAGDAMFSSLSELGVIDGMLLAAGAATFALTRGRIAKPVAMRPWVCGISTVTSRMQYTADSFSQPVVRVFAAVIRPSVQIDVDRHPLSAHTVRSRTYGRSTARIVEDALWQPALAAFARAARWGKRLQSGSISGYATWMLLGIVAVLLAARWL